MKVAGRLAGEVGQGAAGDAFPRASELAALRAWYAGLSARAAVAQYLGQDKASGQSSRAMLGTIRRRLASYARARHREDFAALMEHPAAERDAHASAAKDAIEILRSLPMPAPLVTDPISRWLPARAARAITACGIKTLADLTVRVPHRRRWWTSVPGLGARSASQIEAFFAAHSQLTEQARVLVVVPRSETLPWERFVAPTEVDGSRGVFRAPQATCTLSAKNDYEAVQTWLELQESAATQRAYRKEAERLMLWAILERGKALSSLTTEDAIAYRAFLRRPTPRDRWVGPARPRTSPEWRPFQGALSARSVAYALSVLAALYRWLIEQRYLLANPFAGVKVKGAQRGVAFDSSRVFTEHEWSLIRSSADGIEWIGGWSEEGAQRLRFVLDFWYATGLRPSEMVGARLGNIEQDAQDDLWLNVVGKGSKHGKVALPLLARGALDRYLAQRRLPVTRSRWNPRTVLVAGLAEDGGGITAARLWAIMRRFFLQAARSLREVSPSTAGKLERATPHWMRHTHATHALARGVELTTVRDNLRHASVATTSVYLHTDEVKRARQIGNAFPA
ncbi:phage integrase family protein [Variovorax ureilyticus]|uniref:phage integrase family protein n=1 Tax=Variovorax ureilyticus TaxID=1836198 RepID=UPI003D67793E